LYIIPITKECKIFVTNGAEEDLEAGLFG
jgi:hypothetical protein